MTTAATKSTRSHTATVSRSGGFFGPSRSAGFFSPVLRKARSPVEVQTKLSVSKPADPLEKQADRAADQVMRMPDQPQRTTTSPVTQPPTVQRAVAERVQRFGLGAPSAAANVKESIQQASTGGQTLSSEVTTFMQPRLGADVSNVRVHTDEGAASLNNHLSARAFTYGNHVFFGRNQYQPGSAEGRHLIAHELSHTIQQGATVQRKAAATPEVQRAQSPPLVNAGPTPSVQRLGIQDALDYFADKANYIPGFRMLTLVLGFNPVNMRGTDRTAANFLRALIELLPGGAVITRVLDSHGVINQAADWVEQKAATLGDIGAGIVASLKRFIDSLGWSDIFSLGDVWDRAKRIFTDPIGRLISFGTGVVGELLGLVKKAILRPLAALAKDTRGYDLLKAILGRDPITDEPYPRTPETLIGGFMKLIGQQELWENLKRGKAVQRAFAWFEGALSGLIDFVTSIPGRIMATLRSLTFEDVITVVGAFRKVGGAFLDLAAEFGSWALKQVLSLLEILVSVVAPHAMPYIAKAKTAFQTIVRDPIGFVGNLVRAGKLGFQKFAGNILEHLKEALIKWLVGPLAQAGVYIPKSFSLLEIVKLVLSVLGLTWANIRSKLVKIIPDPVLATLEKTAAVLVTLVNEGPAAAWQQIVGELTELKDQLISQVTSMIQMEVVKAAVTKLVMMLNPAGAVVQAIMAIWNTVSFFIEKIQQIGAVVASFIDSIAAIASGQVENAAKKVEKTMANTLVVVIGFLAKFAGLGGIPAKLVAIVTKIRAPIDKALDRIVGWLGKMLDKLVNKAKDTVKKLLQWWKKKVPIRGGAEPHTLTFQGEKKSAKLVVMSDPTGLVTFMTQKADARKNKEADIKTPLSLTQAHANTIAGLQTDLAAFDNNEAAAASDKRAEANAKDNALTGELNSLSLVIGNALVAWGSGDADELLKFTEVEKGKEVIIKEFKIKRGGFSDPQKRKVAEEAKRLKQDKHLKATERDDGREQEDINVAAGYARRHVVSAGDMRQHYMKFLNNKRASAAKLLLEQRGSIAGARTPVGPTVNAVTIREAAIARYSNFFGYAKNIFLGDSKENSSIQEHLDKGHPEMQTQILLDEHVDRIKRGWALDPSMEITPVKKG